MFYIKETKTTPEIKISIADGIFEIKGNSNASDVNRFYVSVSEELKSQFTNFNKELICKFKFNVFNSATFKNLIQIFVFLNEKFNSGKDIKVEWFYNNSDIDNKNTGSDLSDIFDFPVKLIETKKE